MIPSGQITNVAALYPLAGSSSQTVALTSGTTWLVPADFTASNSIQIIGAGGSGTNGIANTSAGAPGGGAEFSKIINVNLTPGSTVNIQVAAGGSGQDTYLQNNTNTTVVLAKAGGNASGLTAGLGGTGGIGPNGNFAGGKGINTITGTSKGGGGGGGSAGPSGVGKDGGRQTSASAGGGGGGGSNGGLSTAGASISTASGGNGGQGTSGTGQGLGSVGSTPATSGTLGGGGGGGGGTTGHGQAGNGGNDTCFDATHGAGGGGGGGGGAVIGSGNENGGNGGTYGGGAGGGGSAVATAGTAGTPGQGIIFITYTPIVAGPLRNVATRGAVHNSTLVPASGKTRFKGSFFFAIGTNAANNLQVVWDNFYQNAAASPNQEISNPDIVTLSAVAIVYNGINVPLTFSGSQSTTIAAGAVDIKTDTILASAFGVSFFTAGSSVEVRWEGDHASGTAYVCVGSKANLGPNDQEFRFTPANDIPDVYSTGPMAAPVGSDSPAIYSPTMIVGNFEGPTVSLVNIGDSIADGGDDTAGIGLNGAGSLNPGIINGGGYLRRTATELGYAFCNMSCGGNRMVYFSSQFSLRATYFKYFTHAITQLGDNDCAGGIANTSQIAAARTIWASLNSSGVQFIAQCLILPKKDTDNFHQTDLANQVDLSGYDSIRALLNAATGNSYPHEVGSHFLNAAYDINSGVQDTGDTTKWGILSYTTTTAAGITAGTTTASLNLAPSVGDTLVFDPGSANADFDQYVISVTGTGPFTATFSGAFINSHLSGIAVRRTPCYDGTHPTSPTHVTITNTLVPFYTAFTSSN